MIRLTVGENAVDPASGPHQWRSDADGLDMGISAVATASFLALWAAVLFDVWRTDHRFVRQGPKWCWMVFVAALPVLGAMAWLAFGRPFFTVRKDPVLSLAGERAIGPEDTDAWTEFLRFESIVQQADRLD